MRKILCITAHPDDEAGAFGGTLALYSSQGVECRLICLTAGGAARNRGGARDPAELMAMRRGELAESCKILGLRRHEVWDLPDAGLMRVDLYAAGERLAASIRDFRPDLVLTLGPEGSATAHPDHGMAGTLATAAFHWAAQERFFPDSLPAWQAKRLFYATARAQPPQFPRVLLPPADVAIRVTAFVDTKVAAFRAHTTQAPLADRVETFMRAFGDRELFHLAAGEGTLVRDPERDGDLFAGLDGA